MRHREDGLQTGVGGRHHGGGAAAVDGSCGGSLTRVIGRGVDGLNSTLPSSFGFKILKLKKKNCSGFEIQICSVNFIPGPRPPRTEPAWTLSPQKSTPGKEKEHINMTDVFTYTLYTCTRGGHT